MGIPIYLITDYKGNFGSKYNDYPYRSGFDKNLLTVLFNKNGYHVIFLNPYKTSIPKIDFVKSIVLYTSQEDNGLYYKSFLEDFIYALELSGHDIIPAYSLFRAHENKVFFEMLRNTSGIKLINNILSYWFGTLEEFISISEDLKYPVVIKAYNGSMSRGVFIAETKHGAEKTVKKITNTKNTFLKLWDKIRFFKHKGYIRESWNRKKFIIQEYIPGLHNDYKILVYGRKYYVLHRANKKGDFRASGQGQLSFKSELPHGLLDYAEQCFLAFNSPHASFDIGYNGKEFFLFEAQFVYFGTFTLEFSDRYFIKEKDNWKCVEGISILEEEYVESIIEFISK